MNQVQLNQIIANTVAATTDLLTRKGAEYATAEDRLANFKTNATRLGMSPLQVWAVYAFKHVDAIQSYMRRIHSDGCDADVLRGKMYHVDAELFEPIEGRFYDAINYMHLGIALLQDVIDEQVKKMKNSPEQTPLDYKLAVAPWGVADVTAATKSAGDINQSN